MRPITVTVGPLASAAANNICLSQTPTAAFTLNGSLVSGGVAILDTARRVLFTFAGDETGKTITVRGTNWTGDTITETVAGGTGTVATVLDYKTVTSIRTGTAFAAAVTVGTNGVAASGWVFMDPYALPSIGIQCTVVGTVNYTVQSSLDDPNSPTNPVTPVNMTWVSSADTAVVGATATKQSSFSFCPSWIRVLLNSGSGSVTTTITQAGVVPQ